MNKLTSEFNKFKDFGIDLNDAHKTTTKITLTTKNAEKIVRQGEQDLYDFTKEERDKTRNETKNKLLTERKEKKKEKAGNKIVKFARKNFAREHDISNAEKIKN